MMRRLVNTNGCLVSERRCETLLVAGPPFDCLAASGEAWWVKGSGSAVKRGNPGTSNQWAAFPRRPATYPERFPRKRHLFSLGL